MDIIVVFDAQGHGGDDWFRRYVMFPLVLFKYIVLLKSESETSDDGVCKDVFAVQHVIRIFLLDFRTLETFETEENIHF